VLAPPLGGGKGLLPTRYDAVVVGAGPAGSVAALMLARGGAHVALVDKAAAGRDKACGDLIGPRGVGLLEDLAVEVSGAQPVGDMVVVGPSGRRVVLPARPGHAYPGYAIAVPRSRFDAACRAAAADAGALEITARVAGVQPGGVSLDDGRVLDAGAVIGADGAHSAVAESAGLVDSQRALFGFALRTYAAVDVSRPVIVLWNDRPRAGFPGYGWLFPGPDGANLGLGIGLGRSGHAASRTQQQLPAFRDHLVRVGILDRSADLSGRRLGGWLKMGLVGTRPAEGRVLLVGDAAGLVNPLQGEGIAQALLSGVAAAQAVLADPAHPAPGYRRWVRETYGSWSATAAALHRAIVDRPRRIAAVGRVLTAPVVAPTIASTWALYWNDLVEGARPTPAARSARTVDALGRLVTSRATVRRQLERDLRDGPGDGRTDGNRMLDRGGRASDHSPTNR
jgi:geranylgeranyl reductase family protein